MIALLLTILLMAGLIPAQANAAPPSTMTVSETGTLTFAPRTEGYSFYTTPASITLTKVGTEPIANLSVSLSGGAGTKFLLGTILPDSLGAGVLSTVFMLRPKTGLAAGTYTETVTITADNGINESFDVSFTVNAAPPSTMTVSETGTLTFAPRTEGYSFYTTPASITLTKVGIAPITNLGVSLSGGAGTKFLLGTILPDSLGAGVLSTVFMLRPKTGLAAGTYTETVTITADNGINESFDVSFTVNAAPTYSIASIGNQTVTTLMYGYLPGTQELKTITITRTGNAALDNLSAALSGTNADDFILTQPADTLLNNAVPSTTFTVKAKDGLEAGTHTATVTLSATNMTNVAFTVTQVVNPPAPASPQSLVAAGGNRQADLSWDAVTEADYYNIYMGTASEQYDSVPVGVVTDTAYRVHNLTNGTGYYFIVKAGNSGGLSAASNEASATPVSVPSAPTNVTAAGGNGSATISFAIPSDIGGSPITSYEVTASPGNITKTGSASPITITGLSNGTSYTFTVKAINGAGSSEASTASNAVVPSAPSTDYNYPTGEPNTAKGVDILVNGKLENAGAVATSVVNGQTKTSITVDEKKLQQRLASEADQALITIQANMNTDIVSVDFNGQLIRDLEQKQAIVEIKTERAAYTLPAQQIDIAAVAKKLGGAANLQDIKLHIELSAPTADMLKLVESAALSGEFTIVAPAIHFTVKATYNETTIEVSSFNAFVERTIAIPDGVDPNKITTGIVVEPDGTVRHVPTKIAVIDGKYYAKVNSLTNSTYSIVWHPVEFADVAKHWARDAVNDMGSRMVINGIDNERFNPDADITRAEFAAIIVRGLGMKLEGGGASFSDVTASAWYNDVIETAYSYGLIDGYGDGTFRPMDNITREQAMVIIAKAMTITGLKAKLPTKAADEWMGTFTDAIDASAWAKSSIADSLQAGIVSGRSSTQLAPKAYITRAEVAAIIQRLLQQSDFI
nr:S-layer homology domain-containing protein [Paenibacillus oenotherae]